MKNENEKMGTKHERIGNEATDRARVQEVLFPFFIFPFPVLVTSQFHVVVVQWRQRNEQQQQQQIKRDARAKSLFG